MSRWPFALVIVVGFLSSACSRALSHEEAQRLIESSPLIRANEDKVSVDAVSMSSPTEAIVRTSIAGQVTNLKFRKFDRGWTWEFVETKGGGWIAPDQAMAQIREGQRQAAATEWATKHRAEYVETAASMSILMSALPTPKIGFDVSHWMHVRRTIANIGASFKRDGWEERTRVLQNEAAADAWGHEFLVNFDSSDKTALLLSVGVDGVKQTGDDMVCLATARPVFESGDLAWEFDRSWRVPEGLGDVVEKLIDRPRGTVAFSKAVTTSPD